jgi:subtilase family serine protease
MYNSKKTVLAILVVALISLATVAYLAIAQISQPSEPWVAVPNTAPKAVYESVVVGPAPGDKEITVMLVPKLKLDELNEYLKDVYTPGSLNYRKFLSPFEVYAKFGYGVWQPMVVTYASRFGIQVNASGPFVKLKGRISQFEQFFQTRFAVFRYGNTTFYAPASDIKLPATISRYIAGILGLHNITIAKPQVKYLAKIIETSSDRKVEFTNFTVQIKPSYGMWFWAYPVHVYLPIHIHELYRLNPLYKLGLTGAGQTIVIINAFGDKYIGESLKEFNRQFNLPDPPRFTVMYYQATQFPQEGDYYWGLETALDVEWAHAVAPGANIMLVYTPYPDDSLFMAIADIVSWFYNQPIIISLSWGSSEWELKYYGIDITPYETILATAATSGVPVFVASGDWPYDTYYPATSAYVTAVGGTTLFSKPVNNDTSAVFATPIYLFETGWGDLLGNVTAYGTTFYYYWSSWGGSGGGESKLVPKPWYQAPLPYTNKTTPDIALVASPFTGVHVIRVVSYYDWKYTAIYIGVGGTSLATPLMAGIYAVIQQGYKTKLGYANPYLYRMYFTMQKQYQTTFNPVKPNATLTIGGTAYFWNTVPLMYTSALISYISGACGPARAKPWQYNTVVGLGSPNAYYLYQLINTNGTVLNLWQRTATYAVTVSNITWPGQFTASLWAYIPSNMSGKPLVFASTLGSSISAAKWIILKSTIDDIVFRLYTSSSTYVECRAPSGILQKYFNTWIHIAVSYNNATGIAKIYLNGAPVATCSIGKYKLLPAPLYIGMGATLAGATYYTGYLANIQIYGTELLDNEIKALTLAGLHGSAVGNYTIVIKLLGSETVIVPKPMLAWYPLDQAKGTTIYSKIGPQATIIGTSYSWALPPYYPATPTYPGISQYQFYNVTAPVIPK